MGKPSKVLWNVLGGRSDANVRFSDLCALLKVLGFQMRSKGSHHMFSRDGVEELINLQEEGGMAKPYQVRQVRTVLLRYGLSGDLDE